MDRYRHKLSGLVKNYRIEIRMKIRMRKKSELMRESVRQCRVQETSCNSVCDGYKVMVERKMKYSCDIVKLCLDIVNIT